MSEEPRFSRPRLLARAGTLLGLGMSELFHHLLRKSGVLSDNHWCRIVMDGETRRLVEERAPSNPSVLEISGTKWRRQPGFRSYDTVSFPEYDVCDKPLPRSFDLIIAEQVWEHLLWPYRATRHVHQMLNEGGCFLVTTPFLLRVHNEPTDCSRWTETGLKNLLVEGGFRDPSIVTGSWGNRKCLIANLESWVPYNRLLHSLENQPKWPLVVWALAKK